MPRACGASSIPEALQFDFNVSGMLDRPVKPDDDSALVMDVILELMRG
jgi:hypothetical protein